MQVDFMRCGKVKYAFRAGSDVGNKNLLRLVGCVQKANFFCSRYLQCFDIWYVSRGYHPKLLFQVWN